MATLTLAVLVARTYSSGPAAAVVVGSKNFTEQIVLGEILAQAVEQTGLTVERRLNLGGTLVCDQALRSGDIDVYAEYTGTALTALFKEPLPSADATGAEKTSTSARVLDVVRDKYASRGITMLPPLGFNNTFAILVRAAAHETRTSHDQRPGACGARVDRGFRLRIPRAARRLRRPRPDPTDCGSVRRRA